MKKPRVTAIIANYNTRQVLHDCLNNLIKLDEVKQIIVVDNASADDSSKMVKTHFPSVLLLSLKRNKGISYSYNLAEKKAKNPYLLFLGSDAFPKKNAVTFLSDYLDNNPHVGLATCKVVLRNGNLDMDSHRAFPTPWNSFLYFTKINTEKYFLQDRDFSNTHEIDACISHFMFIRRKAFESVNGFDKDYFVYGEDIDFCYRLKKNSWKVMYVPHVTATHYKGVSVGLRNESKDISRASKETKIKMSKMTTDAMELFFRKHYQKSYPALLNLFVLFTIRMIRIMRFLKIRLF